MPTLYLLKVLHFYFESAMSKPHPTGKQMDKLMLDIPDHLILASKSPRRREILARLQIPFRVVPPSFEERSNPELSPKEEAIYFSEGKAHSVAQDLQNAIVIGSDTLIECDGQKIGKPEGAEEAKQILQVLQGRSHLIWTAVFMIDTQQNRSETSIFKIEVKMKSMTETDIADYIATGEPLDKAGAYAIQGEGRRFIQEFSGHYLAAVGLPTGAIKRFVERLSRRVALYSLARPAKAFSASSDKRASCSWSKA